jgi:hypothetical protein
MERFCGWTIFAAMQQFQVGVQTSLLFSEQAGERHHAA